MRIARFLRPVFVVSVVLAAGAVGVACANTLSDEQRATVLAEAQAAYDRGVAALRADPEGADASFRLAATRFRQLVDDGVANGPLHYNLANAHMQAGDLGRAILHYRIAARFMPGDTRLAHNLAHARSQRASNIQATGRRALADALLVWHRRTSLGTRVAVFEVAFVGFWLVLAINLVRPHPLWRWIAGVGALVWIVTAVSVAADVAGRRAPDGVVLADAVVARKGNGTGFEPQFAEPLTAGVEFRVLETRGRWLRIELPDANTGWIPADAAGLVTAARQVARNLAIPR